MGLIPFIAGPLAALALAVLLTDLVCYGLLTPEAAPAPARPGRHQAALAAGLRALAYALSVLRLPFALAPYLARLAVAGLLPNFYRAHWRNNRAVQLARLAGDGLNLALTGGLLLALPLFWNLAVLSIAAESARLIAEKGQMLFSAAWQLLPHRALARRLRPGRRPGPAERYRAYYALDDAGRVEHVLRWLARRAAADPEAARPIAYVHALRIVPPGHNLETGHVRDVARGEVFIHRAWTNDPWLLIGQALRRGPWLFDPRYLRRPFFYRSEWNPLATCFVLAHAGYSPPYACYQFGHEIKVARYHLFFALLRRLGLALEQPVRADGTYAFDPLLAWLTRNRAAPPTPRPLWSDAEVVAAVLEGCAGHTLTPEEIARIYVYPREYVAEVLLARIQAARAQAPDYSKAA